MTPLYLYDVGIKPWEQMTSFGDSRFATITVVHRSVSEVFDLWLVPAAAVSQCLPRILKWRTVGHSIEGSKVQELRLIKQLKSCLSKDDYLEKNRESGVFSYIKELHAPLDEFDLNTITQSRHTVLLFLPADEPNNNAIWEMFKHFDGGLGAEAMESSLSSVNGLVISRLFESDTHVSLQFVGELEMVDTVLLKLSELGIDMVEEGEVARLIS